MWEGVLVEISGPAARLKRLSLVWPHRPRHARITGPGHAKTGIISKVFTAHAQAGPRRCGLVQVSMRVRSLSTRAFRPPLGMGQSRKRFYYITTEFSEEDDGLRITTVFFKDGGTSERHSLTGRPPQVHSEIRNDRALHSKLHRHLVQRAAVRNTHLGADLSPAFHIRDEC